MENEELSEIQAIWDEARLHEVALMGFTVKTTRAAYPKIVKKHGKSPPQYSGH
ncbi:MAG: hypothetical protein ACRKGH_02445 [Dehalogenimonas sp.]